MIVKPRYHTVSHLLSISGVIALVILLSIQPTLAQQRTVGCAPNAIVCRISVAPDGTQSNQTSAFFEHSDVSADGRFIAFESSATNLVANDTNNFSDIFVHDRQSGTTTRVSVSTLGVQGNGTSSDPSISSDGRYIVFSSLANNLVTGDSNNITDVFLHDRNTQVTTRVSISSGGAQGNALSTEGNISADGNFIAFASFATNLVDNDTNSRRDIFVRNLATNETSRVSISSSGEQANNVSFFPYLSGDGRYVTFHSTASNLVAGDTGWQDVFVHDRNTGITERVSLKSDGSNPDGPSGTPSISEDGRYVTFESLANLVPSDPGYIDIYVYDRETDTITLASPRNSAFGGVGNAEVPIISGNGRYIAYHSDAANLVFGDTNGWTDIYVYDRQTNVTRRVSVAADGTEGNQEADYRPAFSSDGTIIVYSSEASNLVDGDTNGFNDIFVADWQRLSFNLLNNSHFGDPLGNANGNWAAFAEPADGIVANPSGGVLDFHRQPGSAQAVILQQTGVPVAANSGLDIRLSMGNGGASRKRFTILVHDATFQDLQICSFWLAPNALMQIYKMHARTTRDWTNATISIYAATADGTPSYRLDNVSMSINPTNPAPARTMCVSPNAPAPAAGADSANFITNGDFGVNSLSGGDNNWGTFFNIFAQISGGQLEMYNLPRTPPDGSGVVLQNTTNPIPINTPFQIDFTLGSTIPNWTRVAVIVHRRDFADLQVCLFWLPPNTTAGTYMMRSYTTQAWDSANPLTLSLYPNPGFASPPGGVIQVDDVIARSRPMIDVSGTECYEPGTLPPDLVPSHIPVLAPILLPTATAQPYVAPNTSAEIPVIGTPAAPIEAPSSGEGSVSE